MASSVSVPVKLPNQAWLDKWDIKKLMVETETIGFKGWVVMYQTKQGKTSQFMIDQGKLNRQQMESEVRKCVERNRTAAGYKP